MRALAAEWRPSCAVPRACVARGRGGRRDVDLLHVAADRAAVGNDQAAIANRSRDSAGSMDDEARSGRDLSRELAVDFRDVDLGRALERSRLRDLHLLAVHGRLDMPLDNEEIAIGDLHALELDVDADVERSFLSRAPGPSRRSRPAARSRACSVTGDAQMAVAMRRRIGRQRPHGR